MQYEAMKNLFVISSLVVLLSACGDARQNAGRMADDLKENYEKTSDRVKEWMTATPKPVKQPVPASYCYVSLQDILCYRQPMPGWESRLVGYQGTDAPSPHPAMTQALPTRTPNDDMLPEKRAETTKPLAPGLAKAEDTSKEKAPADAEVKVITIDAAHESLPDPTLAPQL